MNKFMEIAIAEARIGIKKGHGGPFGTVIVKDNKVIAKAHNKVLKKRDATSHGEIEAIRKASRKLKTHDLSGCELYTTGEPCPMCLGAILWSNISKVYYGCNVKDTEKIGFRDKAFYELDEEKKKAFIKELDREGCLLLYKEYHSQKDKINY